MTNYIVTILLFTEIVALRYPFHWSYEEENKWPGDKCRLGGSRQSPIDIKRSDIVKDFEGRFIKYGEVVLSGYQAVNMAATNNEYTIMFSAEGSSQNLPTMRGGPLRQPYRLEQMHLHWLSEHAIDGAKFPVEIHLVHVRSDLDVRSALKRRDGLAILALFGKIIEQDELEVTAFDEMTAVISRLHSVGSRLNGVVMDLTKLIAPNTSIYYTYAGSLTSPMCNEVVTWILFPEHVYITETQYNLLEKLREGHYNYRSLQPVVRQTVYQPPMDFLMEPQIVTSIKNALISVVNFFTNVRSFMMKGFDTP